MKSKISALMDGELKYNEADCALDALKIEGDARDAWRNYHMISDSMRDTRLLSAGFAARVAAKLAHEPTVMAPSRLGRQTVRTPAWALAAAAGLAVAFVGGSAFLMLQQGADSLSRIAAVPAKAAPAKDVAQVAPPDAAHDYLLAHQGYSPRNSLQGMAPYVRTVSGDARASAR